MTNMVYIRILFAYTLVRQYNSFNDLVTMTPQESTPSYPGATYVDGLIAVAELRGISLAEATEQTIVELREGFSEEHIEPTRQALAWILANPQSIE